MINIMFAGNYKMFDGVMLALLSITKHTTRPISAYVFTGDFSDMDQRYRSFDDNQIKCLDTILKNKNAESRVIKVDLSEYKSLLKQSVNLKTRFSVYCFLRLFAHKVDLPSKIIYLDTDVMACDDISKLYDIDISDYELAAVKDRYGKVFLGPNYFNSGVMLLNMEKIKETGLFETALDMCIHKKMFLPDQTALNKTVQKIKYLPTRFNSQKKVYNDTVLRHFCNQLRFFPYFHAVSIKPWNIEGVHNRYKCHDFDDVFAEYQQIIKKYKEEYKYE